MPEMVPVIEALDCPKPIFAFFNTHFCVLKSMLYIGKFFTWCLEKGHHGGEKLKEKAGKGMFWALLLFVGIPLPGTGAWTGTLAASLLDLDFKKSILAVSCGVLLAAVIITAATLLGFGAFSAVK